MTDSILFTHHIVLLRLVCTCHCTANVLLYLPIPAVYLHMAAFQHLLIQSSTRQNTVLLVMQWVSLDIYVAGNNNAFVAFLCSRCMSCP